MMVWEGRGQRAGCLCICLFYLFKKVYVINVMESIFIALVNARVAINRLRPCFSCKTCSKNRLINSGLSELFTRYKIWTQCDLRSGTKCLDPRAWVYRDILGAWVESGVLVDRMDWELASSPSHGHVGKRALSVLQHGLCSVTGHTALRQYTGYCQPGSA